MVFKEENSLASLDNDRVLVWILKGHLIYLGAHVLYQHRRGPQLKASWILKCIWIIAFKLHEEEQSYLLCVVGYDLGFSPLFLMFWVSFKKHLTSIETSLTATIIINLKMSKPLGFAPNYTPTYLFITERLTPSRIAKFPHSSIWLFNSDVLWWGKKMVSSIVLYPKMYLNHKKYSQWILDWSTVFHAFF